jgi:hypothetical protein
LFIILSHVLSKLGSNRASCLGGLGFEPRHRDGQDFRIFCLFQKDAGIVTSYEAQKDAGIVTSYEAQKPASSNPGFIIHIRCAVRLFVISLTINDVTLFN